MTDGPSVSVIVPAYGVAPLIGEALASLQAQTRPDWEAIVVDDGDQDVAPVLGTLATDERIRLLRTDNGGLAVARNRAAGVAKAPLLALLDGDDAYFPNYVEDMLAVFDDRPSLGFATCDATYFGLPDRAGRLFSEFHAQQGPVTLARVLARQFNVFVGSVIRKDAFDAIGGFDASLRSCEDLDLWIRLLGSGYEAAYVPRPLSRYRRRHGSLSTNTVGMVGWEARVYRKAAAALDGRAEQTIALESAERLKAHGARARAEHLILNGDAKRGVALLRRYRLESLRWRTLVLAMQVWPQLGRPIFRLRNALNGRARQMGP